MAVEYLCVIGDHHCSAGHAVVPYVCAMEDPRLVYRGRIPHPDNIKVSWQSNLARSLNLGLHTDAVPHRTPGTMLEVAKKWLLERSAETKLLIIGWPSGWPVPGADNSEEDQITELCEQLGVKYFGFRVEDMVSQLLQEGYTPVKDQFFGKDGQSFLAKKILQELLTNQII